MLGYPSKWLKVSSGLQANFTGRVTLSPGSSLPALLTCFVMRDILCNVQDWKFPMENTSYLSLSLRLIIFCHANTSK